MSAIASSVNAPVVMPQGTKRSHAEMSGSDISTQQSPPVQSSSSESPVKNTSSIDSKVADQKITFETKSSESADPPPPSTESAPANDKSNDASDPQEKARVNAAHKEVEPNTLGCDVAKFSPPETSNSVNSTAGPKSSVTEATVSPSGASEDKMSGANMADKKDSVKAADATPQRPSKIVAPSQRTPVSSILDSAPEAMETTLASSGPSMAKTTGETAASQPVPTTSNNEAGITKAQLEDGEEPEKKAKLAVSTNSNKSGGKTPEQILEYMDKTFEQRRKIITKQMPTIPELKELYPDLFMGKQLLIEFQRITKIDIDQKIQEFCVRYATAVIEMARNKKGAAPVLARWEQAKQENDTLKQYWDMVTALCLLPLHFGENFVEMVLEIGEEEEVVAQGKIVPTLVARGNIFRTDEFFLIAENTIVQEFEEFTIAFASLYSSYWVFNMVYPETIENTYNYIQRCIVRQREPGSIPTVCKNFTKALQKWNKGKEGK